LNKEIGILLPVLVSFLISFLHIIFYKLSRDIRKWFSLLGGLIVLGVTFYSIITHSSSLFWPQLTGFFAVLISVLGFFVISYSQGYNPEVNFVYDSLLFFFIGSMLGVVLSSSLISFYIFWELMTLSSFFLVFYNKTEEARKFSIKYLIMTGAGSIFLLFGILGIMSGGISQNILLKHLLFFSIIVGAGVKAGLFPLHSWLPDAYLVAPTPISALLAGVMEKLGIYAIIKFYFVIFHPGWSIGWENIMIIIGVLTLLGGVIFALIQHDIKRLLAFHSISQIGYIFLGIACGTNLGLVGALYHTMNHAIFKGLLFIGAGVVIKEIGSRELDDYGGLGKRMPFTFLVFLIASFSISGIPPFNGFVSKWIIYRALLLKKELLSTFACIMAILGSGLTLASFVKVLNDTFMGVKRKEFYGEKKPISPFMSIPMGLLAAGCLFLGIFPGFVINKIFHAFVTPEEVNISLIKLASFYGWIAIMVTFLIFIFFKKLSGKMREVKPFIGGETLDREKMNFSGSHFYLTLRELPVLKTVYNLEEKGWFDIYQIFNKILSKTEKSYKSFELSLTDNLYDRIKNKIIDLIIKGLKQFHNASLARYFLLVLLGIVIIIGVLKR